MPSRDTAKLSDLQLWQEFQSGSDEAFAMIYKENAGRLYSYGMKLVGDKELVVDAIQDLFVEIWDARERLGKVRSIKSYLYRSIRRKVIAQATKQRKGSTRIEEALMDTFPSAEYSLIEKQQYDQERKELRSALAKLPSNQQELIHLKYHARLSYKEISEIMEMDKKAVYNLMARAIHQLRQHLDIWTYLGFLSSLF